MSHGEIVTFPTENYLGDGEGVMFGDPALLKQGLIVIHEWWGVNEQIEQEAEMISLQGNFCCLVPDIYRGKKPNDEEEARRLYKDLDWNGAGYDIEGAVKFLIARGCEKVGVTGFGMGGALSFLSVLKIEECAAAAPFYGIPEGRKRCGDLTNIRKPIQCHFAKHDATLGFSTPTQYVPLREKLRLCQVPVEFHEYEAQHAFTNPTSPGYDKVVADRALGRMFAFMHKHLASSQLQS